MTDEGLSSHLPTYTDSKAGDVFDWLTDRRRTGAANRVDLVSRAHLAGVLTATTRPASEMNILHSGQ